MDRIQRQHGLTAVAHLTCVNSTQEQIRELLGQIRALGVKNVLALRGDPPGGGEFRVTAGGFEFSSQLVRFIREQGNFCIGVAGFPEGHIACKEGKHVDWVHLKEKVEAGADFVYIPRLQSAPMLARTLKQGLSEGFEALREAEIEHLRNRHEVLA